MASPARFVGPLLLTLIAWCWPAHAQVASWVFRGASAGVPSWNLTETAPSDAKLNEAIARMKRNGVNWYQIGVAWFTPSLTATTIEPIFDRALIHPAAAGSLMPTVSDARLEQVIATFHRNGIKVYLRPSLEPNMAAWRGDIAPLDWNQWFASYGSFIGHYARLAQRTGVEMLSVGLELNSSVGRTDNWRALIAQVRTLYTGAISYDCGGVLYHGRTEDYKTASFTSHWQPASAGEFLDQVDYIGVDWYPQIASSADSGVQEMTANVSAIANAFLLPLHRRYNKPIYFGEIDFASADKAAMNPLRYRSGQVDEGEQATAYEAVFRALDGREWFVGMFPASHFLQVGRDQAGTTNSIWFKAAEGVFQRWYGGPLAKTICLFDWAERTYDALFTPRKARAELDYVAPYYYRHYPDTGMYLGVSSDTQRIWLLGPATQGRLVDVGAFDGFVAAASC